MAVSTHYIFIIFCVWQLSIYRNKAEFSPGLDKYKTFESQNENFHYGRTQLHILKAYRRPQNICAEFSSFLFVAFLISLGKNR